MFKKSAFPLTAVFFVTAFLTLGSARPAQATEVGTSRTFGLGLEFGDPFAIVGKLFIGGGNALDFGIGFGGYGYARCRDVDGRHYYCGDRFGHDISFHGDYLWQDGLVHDSNFKLDWHIGVGARIIFESAFDRAYVDLIARVPIGLDATFTKLRRLEVFAEFAPGLVIVPPLWFDLDLGIGFRIYF
jgi:hypothetical protein